MMVEDIEQSELHDLKPVKDEDAKNIKYIKIEEDPGDFKREDYNDSEPVDVIKKGEDKEVVYLGIDLAETPALYKAGSQDTETRLESEGFDTSERDPNILVQTESESPDTGTPDGEQALLRETPLLSRSQEVEITASDEQFLSPVHNQKDAESPIVNPRSPASDNGVNTGVGDEQPVLDGHAELFSPPSRKRRRIVLDAVVLPTLASVLGESFREQATKEEIEEKIKMLSNPKVKKKKNMDLSIDTVRERLRNIGYDLYPVPLDKETQDITVTRQFMSAQYGGNPMETFPKVSEEKLAVHGLDDFAFLNPDMNPQAPQIPGAPGLFFAINAKPGSLPTGSHNGDVWRLFSRLRIGVWLYCGQYKVTQVPSLTKEEWADQKPKVRRSWAKHVCTKVWGRDSRARIHLRQELGREPTVIELNRAMKLRSEYTHITPDQVSEAFLHGQETMAVYTLQCIGYDVAFQLNLAEKSPVWIPPPPKPKGEKKLVIQKSQKQGTSRAPRRTAAAIRKWSWEDREWSEAFGEGLSSDEDYPEDDDGEEEQFGPILILGGTRLRPIRVDQ